jgi:hypothetical protein
MIVKVQLPLASNAPKPECLVYNEDRSVEAMLPVTNEVVDLFGADEVKAFFYATLKGDNIELQGRAPWQIW